MLKQARFLYLVAAALRLAPAASAREPNSSDVSALGVQSCDARCQSNETDCDLRCDQVAPCVEECQKASESCVQKCREAPAGSSKPDSPPKPAAPPTKKARPVKGAPKAKPKAA